MKKFNGNNVDKDSIKDMLKKKKQYYEEFILGECFDREILYIMGMYFKLGKFYHVYDTYDEMLYSCEEFIEVFPIIRYLEKSYANWQKDDIMKHLRKRETNDMINDALNNNDE